MMSQLDTHYMTCMRVVVLVCADVIATPHTDIMVRHDKCLRKLFTLSNSIAFYSYQIKHILINRKINQKQTF